MLCTLVEHGRDSCNGEFSNDNDFSFDFTRFHYQATLGLLSFVMAFKWDLLRSVQVFAGMEADLPFTQELNIPMSGALSHNTQAYKNL